MDSSERCAASKTWQHTTWVSVIAITCRPSVNSRCLKTECRSRFHVNVVSHTVQTTFLSSHAIIGRERCWKASNNTGTVCRYACCAVLSEVSPLGGRRRSNVYQYTHFNHFNVTGERTLNSGVSIFCVLVVNKWLDPSRRTIVVYGRCAVVGRVWRPQRRNGTAVITRDDCSACAIWVFNDTKRKVVVRRQIQVKIQYFV